VKLLSGLGPLYGGVSKQFPLPSHYTPLQQGYAVTQQHLHTNVGISAPEPIVTHGINVQDLAVASEGSEVRDNCSISA
jgi:phage tail protein X